MPDETEVLAVALHRDAEHRLRLPGETYALAAPAAAATIARGVAIDPATLPAVDWWGAPGRVLAAEPLAGPEPVFARAATPGALTIVQGTGYDPGNAAYRFHSAVNETTPHASAFVRWAHTNRSCDLRQYDGDDDLALVRQMVRTADVVHCHVDYLLINNTGVRPTGLVVRHYHGSRPDGRSLVEQPMDDARGAIQVGARLSLLAESPRMQWLPITVPVARYRALREAARALAPDGPRRPFRIAHSPTHRGYKGTDAFLAVVGELRSRGHPVEAVCIEGVSHGEALRLKATCDAVFDSFWLGIQGSGLEGGAMGLPVIAGDATVAALYREHVGAVPYTFADDARALRTAIAALASDPAYRAAEAARVAAYVAAVHDYPAVAARYDAMLREALR